MSDQAATPADCSCATPLPIGGEREPCAIHGWTVEPPATAATEPDWTVNHEGRSNSSLGFHAVVAEVEWLIRGDAHMLLSGRADKTARLIVAQLAHKFGMTPDPASEAYSEAKVRWAIEGTEDAH